MLSLDVRSFQSYIVFIQDLTAFSASHYCAQLQYATQHRTVLILEKDNHYFSDFPPQDG